MASLNKAEKKFLTAVDSLHNGIVERRSGEVPKLRQQAGEAERVLCEALTAASASWRAHWLERAKALEPELHRLASVVAQYNALNRLAGLTAVNPAALMLGHYAETLPRLSEQDLVDDSRVPAESPDSYALEQFKGAWR